MTVASATGHSRRRIVVISPHLDDAVFSLGAWIAHRARAGDDVVIVTVFAADPTSAAPAGAWDRLCGFETAGAAARARREEDRRACALVGAEPRWLDFSDEQYGDHNESLVWDALRPHLEGARVLVPGFPLAHIDHRWLAHLVLARLEPGVQIGLYLEQPYAAASTGATGSWLRLPSGHRDRASKRRASAAYRSQMRLLRGKMLRVAIVEAVRSRESVCWVEGPAAGMALLR